MPVKPGVPFLWPTAISLSEIDSPQGEPARQWIQVAKVGKFFSSRYGRFEISKDDLKTMLFNFQTITPIAPTQIPIDYDHLSMDPKTPGDGKAAGWFEGLELRDNGSTLWGHVKFTSAAAESIRNGEYRFVSPSFVKNYIWKNGKNIGTTLIASGLTNHPFLEGMEAVTLSNAMGELAIELATSGGNAMEVGQVVAIKPEVDPTRVGQSFEILEVAGTGADAFAKLKDGTGAAIGWYRVGDLAPAPVADPNAVAPPAVPAAPAAPKVPGTNPFAPKHMSNSNSEDPMTETFKLRDTRGQEIDVKADAVQAFLDEQIAAAVDAKKKEVVPDGSVVISATKLTEFEATGATVTSLRNEVTSLREANEKAAAVAHVAGITKRLDGLSRAGKITKPERDWVLKTYSDPVALAAFEEWETMATARPALVNLGKEHGTGAADEDAPASKPDGQLLQLAQARAKADSVPLRDALRLVSMERTDLSETYREQAPDVKHLSRNVRH